MQTRKLHRQNVGEVVGSYAPNQFMIVLEEHAALLSGHGVDLRVDAKHSPTFVHEYWHFLHNVTTIAGFKSFSFSQQLLPLFSRTVAPDGSSRGSAELSEGDRDTIRELVKLQEVFEGDVNGPEVEPESARVIAAVVFDSRLTLRGKPAASQGAQLRIRLLLPNEEEREIEMRLGACAIEESVAATVEHEVAKALGLPPDRLPEFPYRVVQRVVEHVVGAPTPPRVQAALGTLSLMCTHPGPALLRLAELYRERVESGLDARGALAAAAEAVRNNTEAIDLVLNQDVPEIERVHAGRGWVEDGIHRVAGLFREGLRARLDNMLFDIEALDTDGGLADLYARFPCLLVQRRPGGDDDWQRDLLVTLDGDRANGAATGHHGLAALLAQQTHWAIHLDGPTSRFKAPLFGCECPFYTSCDLELRAERADDCKRNPWVLSQEKTTCWYGAGVSATRGKFR